MGYACRAAWIATLAIAWAVAPVALRNSAHGQFNSSGRFELSDSIYLDSADSGARRHLEQAQNFVAARQWEDAIDTWRQVMQDHGDKMVKLTDRRYVSLREFCHLQLVALPHEALALFRRRVDPQAAEWYKEGLARRDPARLRQVIDQLFASSWCDDALYALGELALEQADYASARAYLEMIVPSPAPDREDAKASPRLAIPDSQFELADVRARLVVVSILEGSAERAAQELDALVRLHPEASGRLGGRVVNYHDMLSSLLEASGDWPRLDPPFDWPTFAGSPTRDAAARGAVDVGALAWRAPLPKIEDPDTTIARSYGFRPRRVAEDSGAMLSYHPLVHRDVVLVNTADQILAMDLHSGEAAWGHDSAAIYRDSDLPNRPAVRSNSLGAPRYTMTIHGNYLYARMGAPITSQAAEFLAQPDRAYLVCLDLNAQGRLVWRADVDEEGWAFEGSPAADEAGVYVAMRRSGVRPEAYVACFDTDTGRVRWRRSVCAAETPARGQTGECTHNLLTLHESTLYYNTNLGAVAALAVEDGRTRWVTLYRRAQAGDLNAPAAHWYRDLNPCVYHRGLLLVAPADSDGIFALDAQSGQMLWETRHASDAVHLLGVGGENLLASGDRLWWIDLATGRINHLWPDGPSPKGYGRGVLAGKNVYWPTRQEIHVFDQATARHERLIALSALHGDVTAGNLVAGDGVLLIAGAEELVAFSQFSRLRDRSRDEIALGDAEPRQVIPPLLVRGRARSTRSAREVARR